MQELQTGVGRIVWGNPAVAQKKMTQTKPKQVIMKDGQPVMQWAFGVAFPKAEFQRDIWPYMSAEVSSVYGHGAPGKFAWKYVDGDTVDGDGVPYSQREGYAGCYVLTISTEAFAPLLFVFQNGAWAKLDPSMIKTGDYVSLGLKLVVNVPTDKTHTPSLYVNPTGVMLVGQGNAIVNSANPEAIFKNTNFQLPPGAAAPANTGMPGAGGQMQPQQPMGGYQQQPAPMQQPQQMQPQGYQQQPGMQPQPMGYQQPMGGGQPGMPGQPQQNFQQPQQQMQPQGYQQQQPAPAHDFVQNAGMQQPQGGYQQQPAPMQQPQQMQPQGYQQQPGMQPQPMGYQQPMGN